VVVISGGKHTIPLMEALAVEAQKAGGLVTMFPASDKVIRSRYMDVPEDYLAQEPHYLPEWLKQVDVLSNLPEASDIKALQVGVSAARFVKISGYAQSELDKIAMRLNQRPRKTLGFETPASRLRASVASTG
jgi:hypothetical protein